MSFSTMKSVQQPFEVFPDLACEIERMASTGVTGSLQDWQRFTDALNAAVHKAERLRSALQRAVDFYDGLDRLHDDGEAEVLDTMAAALKSGAPMNGGPAT